MKSCIKNALFLLALFPPESISADSDDSTVAQWGSASSSRHSASKDSADSAAAAWGSASGDSSEAQHGSELSAEAYALLKIKSRVVVLCEWAAAPQSLAPLRRALIIKKADHNDATVVLAGAVSVSKEVAIVYGAADCTIEDGVAEICIYDCIVEFSDVLNEAYGHKYQQTDCRFIHSMDDLGVGAAAFSVETGQQGHHQTTINIPTVIVGNQAVQVHHTEGAQPDQGAVLATEEAAPANETGIAEAPEPQPLEPSYEQPSDEEPSEEEPSEEEPSEEEPCEEESASHEESVSHGESASASSEHASESAETSAEVPVLQTSEVPEEAVKLSAEQYALLQIKARVMVLCDWADAPTELKPLQHVGIIKQADHNYATVVLADGVSVSKEVAIVFGAADCKIEDGIAEICIYDDAVEFSDVLNKECGHKYEAADCHFVFSQGELGISTQGDGGHGAQESGAEGSDAQVFAQDILNYVDHAQASQPHSQTSVNAPAVLVDNQLLMHHHTSHAQGSQPAQDQDQDEA